MDSQKVNVLNTAELIDALLDPESYPHPVDVITTIETHISIVFLTGQFAYKLKKPVNFGFLDFSSLEQRKQFCNLEVCLNKRTAPDLYLNVCGISTDKNGLLQITPISENNDKHSKAFEYLVKMKQFDPNQVLGRLLNNHSLNHTMIELLSQQIADFHLQAETVDFSSDFGRPKTQLQPMLDNFPTLIQHFTDQQNQAKLSTLLNWTNASFEQLTQTLIQRRNEGFIRACHGDLHLDNITLIDEQPVLFDGIEFNDYFRWIDVISDLAFLMIDLDFREQTATSWQVLSLYLSRTLDYKSLYLLNFYRVYRTLVRAKITSLRAQQLPNDSLEQKSINGKALKYIDQALNYTQLTEQPKCILLQGVSGSGKSHFANQLLEEFDHFNAIIISSDRIRKSLFGITAQTRVSAEQRIKLYSNEMNQKTYKALEKYASICLGLGFNVIVDATFLKLEHRKKFYQLSEQHDAFNYLFSLETSESLAADSITLRQQVNSNPSDADINIMQRQLTIIEAPSNHENALILNASNLRHVFPKASIQEFLNLPLN
ncbi:MAG TPA: hypothetical protein ENK73_03180 [Thiomicrospira sp.]|nr:hypothetical protein [Thiomicrospira sp.]